MHFTEKKDFSIVSFSVVVVVVAGGGGAGSAAGFVHAYNKTERYTEDSFKENE